MYCVARVSAGLNFQHKQKYIHPPPKKSSIKAKTRTGGITQLRECAWHSPLTTAFRRQKRRFGSSGGQHGVHETLSFIDRQTDR